MDDLRVRAFHQLHEVTALLSEDARVSLARHGLSPARAGVLWLIAAAPSTQRDLAAALDVSPRNITGLVDALVASGHVERTAHPDDRRAHLVRLTPAGQSAVDWMAAGEKEAVDLLFGGLSARRLAEHVASMETVLVALREHAIRPLPGEEVLDA